MVVGGVSFAGCWWLLLLVVGGCFWLLLWLFVCIKNL